MKQDWLHSVGHIHAQDAAIFAGFIFLLIGVVLWHDARKEVKEERKRKEGKK